MAKILIGVTYYSPHISGLTNYAKILAEELSKRGNKVKVISGRYNINLKLKEKNIEHFLEEHGDMDQPSKFIGKLMSNPKYWTLFGTAMKFLRT